jgi:hypothetical protein
MPEDFGVARSPPTHVRLLETLDAGVISRDLKIGGRFRASPEGRAIKKTQKKKHPIRKYSIQA